MWEPELASYFWVAVENVETPGGMGYMRDSHQPVAMWAEEGIVGIRYQATTSEDIAGREDLVCAVVVSKVSELVRVL
jgi:hypothetical protein